MNGGSGADSSARRTIAGLVLAAGESSRMGRDKALLTYRGRTFLGTIIAKLREAGIDRVAVILGHHAEIIRQAAGLSAAGVEVILNPDYRRGQTSSLQAGLAALGKPAATPVVRPGVPDAIVLCLVDHPAFDPATVRALITTFERTRAPVVVPVHGGRRGHPVVVAQPLFAPLLALGPNEGANGVIRAWREQTEQVEVADPGVLVDVDDEAAWRELISQSGRP
ncbi:MAG TPA: nucleotidyltransferase family protein [Terriglobia bacterium]|nr:nucleotidyltransferase family protein [Terriglobia bacterium]